MADEIVDEVHRARQHILAECNGDVDRLIARLKAGELREKHRLVDSEEVRKRSRSSKRAV